MPRPKLSKSPRNLGILASVKIFTTESLRLTTDILRLEYGHLTPAEPYYLFSA